MCFFLRWNHSQEIAKLQTDFCKVMDKFKMVWKKVVA